MIFSNTVARNQNKFNKLKINSNIKLTLPLEGESNGLMPFGEGLEVFLIKLWLELL